MKSVLRWFAPILLLTFQIQFSFSQDEKNTHTFKIIGKTRGQEVTGMTNESLVEYDTNSTDHLFISKFDKDGRLVLKTHYLFREKKFELVKTIDYLFKEQLIRDGIQIKYSEDGSILNEQLFSEGKLKSEIIYYSDGKKQLLVSCKGKVIDGEYKMWYPNGQLYYAGNFKDNLKDGEFQAFNDSGVLQKTGIYKEGKLISGEAIVQDVTYDQPEKPAVYINGNEAFDEYFKTKSAGITGFDKITKPKRIDLRLTIDKKGKVTNIESISELQPNEVELLNAVFQELPEFIPATEENIPVVSLADLNLILSTKGLERNVSDQIFPEPTVMPEFPGGSEALRRYLEDNVRYPREAEKKAIEGKVYVNFIVDETGSITKAKVVKGVYFDLDAEAMRVINNMPKWKPGMSNEKPVKVSYTVPISFRLR